MPSTTSASLAEAPVQPGRKRARSPTAANPIAVATAISPIEPAR
jgi:hypothetical protein